MIEPERLDKALDPVAQVEAQGHHRHNIQKAVDRIGKGIINYTIKLVAFSVSQNATGPFIIYKREIDQVPDHKGQDDGPRIRHQTRRPGALPHGLIDGITDRPGRIVLDHQNGRQPHVDDENGQEAEFHDIQPRPQVLELLRVSVERLRAEIDEEVPGQMPDDKEDQQQARRGNDLLFTDRGFYVGGEGVHDNIVAIPEIQARLYHTRYPMETNNTT